LTALILIMVVGLHFAWLLFGCI